MHTLLSVSPQWTNLFGNRSTGCIPRPFLNMEFMADGKIAPSHTFNVGQATHFLWCVWRTKMINLTLNLGWWLLTSSDAFTQSIMKYLIKRWILNKKSIVCISWREVSICDIERILHSFCIITQRILHIKHSYKIKKRKENLTLRYWLLAWKVGDEVMSQLLIFII